MQKQRSTACVRTRFTAAALSLPATSRAAALAGAGPERNQVPVVSADDVPPSLVIGGVRGPGPSLWRGSWRIRKRGSPLRRPSSLRLKSSPRRENRAWAPPIRSRRQMPPTAVPRRAKREQNVRIWPDACFVAHAEPRHRLPLCLAGDPEQKYGEARTGPARWLSFRECGTLVSRLCRSRGSSECCSATGRARSEWLTACPGSCARSDHVDRRRCG